jgi:hypothetical protein
MIYEPMVCSTQTMHLSCIKVSTISEKDQNEHTLVPRHLVPSGVSKMTFKPMVHLAQTMHLSCTNTTLSPNGKKRDSTRPTSPRSSIGCIQNDFWAYGTFDANHAPILLQDYRYLRKDRNEVPLELYHLVVPSSVSKLSSRPMLV